MYSTVSILSLKLCTFSFSLKQALAGSAVFHDLSQNKKKEGNFHDFPISQHFFFYLSKWE